MRRPHRLLIAVGLLAGGASVALLLRRQEDATPPRASTHTHSSATNLGPLPLDLAEEPTQPAHLSEKIEADGTTRLDADRPAVAETKNVAASPGETSFLPTEGDWRPSMRTASYQSSANRPPPPPPEPPRLRPERKPETTYMLHRIVDGDTLSRLAQRYLGSSKRFLEIYEANRDRLQSPDLLPIGLELRIPRFDPDVPSNRAEKREPEK
jgi:nucleoid-associated protein YgaU